MKGERLTFVGTSKIFGGGIGGEMEEIVQSGGVFVGEEGTTAAEETGQVESHGELWKSGRELQIRGVNWSEFGA